MTNNITTAALALRQARHDRKGIAPISKQFGISDIGDAYAVAEINTHHAESQGRDIVGKKIGLTGKAVQTQLGIQEPDFGMLFHDMQYEDNAVIDISQFLQPKIEAEVAFILGEDVPQGINDPNDLLSAISSAVVVVEIVDSAIADWKITLADTIADNASFAAFVMSPTAVDIENVDMTNIDMQLQQNGKLVSQSNTSDIMHPLHATLWLAKEMERRNRPLKKGEIILSGALGPMVDVKQGDHFIAEIAGLGKVSCAFK